MGLLEQGHQVVYHVFEAPLGAGLVQGEVHMSARRIQLDVAKFGLKVDIDTEHFARPAEDVPGKPNVVA